MDTEREEEFIDRIEDKFPFGDFVACTSLISEAAAISPKACFQLMNEICTLENSQRKKIPEEQLISMVNDISKRFEHPLKQIITDTAISVIRENDLSSEEATRRLQEIRKFPGLYPALYILYFSCYEDTIEALTDEIRDEWEAMDV